MRKVLFAVLSAVLVSTASFSWSGDAVSTKHKLKVGETSGHSSFAPWSGDWWNQKDGDLFKTGRNGKKVYKWNESAKKYELQPNIDPNDLSPLAKYDHWVKTKTGTDPKSAIWEAEEGHHVDPVEAKEYKEKDIDFSWWGHCNGWAAAAALEREPNFPVTKDGIEFTVRDLKGLITESYYGVESDFYGTRYNKPEKEETEAYDKAKELLKNINSSTADPKEYRAWYEKAFETTLNQDYPAKAYKNVLNYFIKWYEDKYVKSFEDLNPADFHMILENIIGKQKSVVVFDITASEAVWNYPAFAYTTNVKYVGKKKIQYPNGKKYWRKVYNVETTVTYADDGVNQNLRGTRTFTKTYKYELYTYVYWGYLRGGKWLGESVEDHPDFAWFPKFNKTGVDYGENPKLLYGKLKELLPEVNLESETTGLVLHANGTPSTSQRTADEAVTYFNPVATGKDVTFSVTTSRSDVATVKYYEQEVQVLGYSWGSDKLVIDKQKPLKELGEGMSALITMQGGTRVVVAYAFDASGKLLAVDEITVKVQ